MEQLFEDYLERLSVIHSEFETTIAGLPQEALDWVPGTDMTALGALIVHVSEAMRYWVGEVAAGINANRDREAEFVAHGRSEAELRQMLADVRTLVREVSGHIYTGTSGTGMYCAPYRTAIYHRAGALAVI